ncbi:MAG: hypothetical protein ACXABY_07890 [Candidatus Thorarchaeota archaeon]
MSDLPVRIRSIKETDHALILDSWVNSVCYSTPAYFWVPQKLCKSIYRRMVGQLLEVRPELFSVIVNEDDEDQVFAWSCVGQDALYFLYVKKEFRREGLVSMLLHEFMERLWNKHGLGGRPGTFAGAQGQEHERSKVKIPAGCWTIHCEGRRNLQYKPSLFQELINGTKGTCKAGRGACLHAAESEGQTVGRGTAQADKSNGQDSAVVEDGRHGQAYPDSIGMVS